MKGIETSIRSAMTDNRLNHLFMIHIYKDELHEIEIERVHLLALFDLFLLLKATWKTYFW